MPSTRVRLAAVLTHGKAEAIGDGLTRLRRAAAEAGVELVFGEDEAAKHGIEDGHARLHDADLAIVLGGDGTILRALRRFLDDDIPVLGVNYGRVGFLSSVPPRELEAGLARAFAGDFETVALPTLHVETPEGPAIAVNDVVVTSSTLGRMVELGWSIGGEDLGRQPCDGIICSAPSGSTAYNLSNGGPVLVWGLDAMAITFVAPHSLHARPLVVPQGRDLVVVNRTADVPVTVLVDGHRHAEIGPGGEVSIHIDDRRSLLATFPELTFFRRYRQTFAS